MDWFANSLLAWAKRFGRRNLPWQTNRTPYRVWVAEIMLQQTQVKSVIEYYQNFVTKLPDVHSLAHASEKDVLRIWSGLGYYRRARYMHETARLICKNHGGEFPNSLEALTALPGIGKSTAGAILALGHNLRGVILDGNVKRVLARIHGIDETTTKSHVVRKLWEFAVSHTPDSRHAEYAQAIMDFGATWCTKHSPRCEECSLQTNCQAYLTDRVHEIPARNNRREPKQSLIEFVLIKDSLNYCLLEKRPPIGIWASLWVPLERSKNLPASKVLQSCEISPALLSKSYHLREFQHTLSHRKLKISVRVLALSVKHSELTPSTSYEWCNMDNLDALPTPRVTDKLIRTVDLGD